ncbi:hypothetical protein MW376_002182 [Citrobacter freundii]|jgi:hypothetical protein|uniref:hypothetical protein n=1 Tax=Citrobacter gillenii TaxID=67828 RepID=UPI0022E4EBED|nr:MULTISPECIES: hypothetical protein [Citrobacter freundii complex]EJB8472098.1 hypothetical protein [Citrobacter freundii]EJB8560515.1 hypothetical protein [Citrobacter freundii]WFZ87278.1 hypothetical protein NFK79_19990 [Citrobacter freundii]
MRAHKQPAIAAWVREASYPVALRLAIIKPTDARYEWISATPVIEQCGKLHVKCLAVLQPSIPNWQQNGV